MSMGILSQYKQEQDCEWKRRAIPWHGIKHQDKSRQQKEERKNSIEEDKNKAAWRKQGL